MPQFYKTKKCPWFASGRCRMDKECNWAHSVDELRPCVDLTRTKLCNIQLKEGSCKNPLCRYAHSRKELRATSDLFKTSICNYWVKGCCSLGNSCRYAHGVDELRHKPQKEDFIPLSVETLPIQIQNLVKKNNFPACLDTWEPFCDSMLNDLYNESSTTSSFDNENKVDSEVIDKSLNLTPNGCNDSLSHTNRMNDYPLIGRSWLSRLVSTSDENKQEKILGVPFILRKYSYSGEFNLGCLSGELYNVVEKYLSTKELDDQSDLNSTTSNENQKNKEHHNNEPVVENESEETTKKLYPESCEEMYSCTPSTASSINDKIDFNISETS